MYILPPHFLYKHSNAQIIYNAKTARLKLQGAKVGVIWVVTNSYFHCKLISFFKLLLFL